MSVLTLSGVALFILFAVRMTVAGFARRPRDPAETRRTDAETIARLDRIAADAERRRKRPD